jgi:hypothetical protein
MEQENGMGLGELLHRAYIAVKRRIVLVLAVILIITGGGVVMSYLRKPMYTASERVSYKASGSMTSQYFQTVVGFCNKSCVIDRANFYYDYYAGHNYKHVSDFIKDFASPDDSLIYDVSKKVDKKYILEERVGVAASSSSATAVSYIFTVKYTDTTESDAYDKVVILLQAIGDEANAKNGDDLKYFGVDITLKDLGSNGTASDWSKSKIVSIAFVISLIVALLSVYVINLTDRTVKEKSEIERLTGVDLLAFIEDQEE